MGSSDSFTNLETTKLSLFIHSYVKFIYFVAFSEYMNFTMDENNNIQFRGFVVSKYS